MERYLTIATLSGIPVIRDSLERPELSVGESEAAMDMRCHVPVVGRNHHGETRTAEASQDPGDSGGVVGVQRTRRLIRRITDAPLIRPRAIATRCCSPPDSVPGNRSNIDEASPTRSRGSSGPAHGALHRALRQ